MGDQLTHGRVLTARLALQELPGALVQGKVDCRRRLAGDGLQQRLGEVDRRTPGFEALGEVTQRGTHASGDIGIETSLESAAGKFSERDFHVAHHT